MAARLRPRVSQILEPNMGLAKYYVCFWPQKNIDVTYYDENKSRFKQTEDTFFKALSSAVRVGLINPDGSGDLKETIKNDNKNPTVTPTPSLSQTCPPPSLKSFAPEDGYTGTIIQLNGENFESIKSIEVSGQKVDMKTLTVFNKNTLRFTLPSITIPLNQEVVVGKISITTEFGTSESSLNFTFNPTLQNKTTSSPGAYQSKEQIQPPTIEQQEELGQNRNPQDIGSVILESESTSIFTNFFNNPITNTLKVYLKPESTPGIISETVLMVVSIFNRKLSNNKYEITLDRTETLALDSFVKDNVFYITYSDVADILINNPQGSFKTNFIKGDQLIEINFEIQAIPLDKIKFPSPVTRSFFFRFK
jgi:hypothetical protein